MTIAAELAIPGPLGPALVKVIRGNPSPDELAAATSVLMAIARRMVAAEEAEVRPERRADWRHPLPEGCAPPSWMSRTSR